MKTASKRNILLLLGLLCLALASPLPAATTIFDNSANDLAVQFEPGTLEVGDQIVFAGTDRFLTGFSFEFWGVNSVHPASFTGTIEAEVRFYQNNGTPYHGYATPSDMFFDSGWFSVPSPTDRSTFVFSAGSDFAPGGLFLPTSGMTWSVQFRGMDAGDAVGVDLYSPPVIGSEVGDYGDYWEYNGGWTLRTNTVTMDFAARFEAVPEPSFMALSLCGGLAILTFARRLRRKD
jgi:hypothetical protein